MEIEIDLGSLQKSKRIWVKATAKRKGHYRNIESSQISEKELSISRNMERLLNGWHSMVDDFSHTLMQSVQDGLGVKGKNIPPGEHYNIIPVSSPPEEVRKLYNGVQSKLRSKYPSGKVKLYRGSKVESELILSSWTDDKKVAEHFASLKTKGIVNSKEIDIKRIFMSYNIDPTLDPATEFGFYDQHEFIVMKEVPKL